MSLTSTGISPCPAEDGWIDSLEWNASLLEDGWFDGLVGVLG